MGRLSLLCIKKEKMAAKRRAFQTGENSISPGKKENKLGKKRDLRE